MSDRLIGIVWFVCFCAGTGRRSLFVIVSCWMKCAIRTLVLPFGPLNKMPQTINGKIKHTYCRRNANTNCHPTPAREGHSLIEIKHGVQRHKQSFRTVPDEVLYIGYCSRTMCCLAETLQFVFWMQTKAILGEKEKKIEMSISAQSLTLFCWKCISEIPTCNSLMAPEPQTKAASLQHCLTLDSFLPVPQSISYKERLCFCEKTIWEHQQMVKKKVFSIPRTRLKCCDTEMNVRRPI